MRLLTAKEVALILNVTPARVYELGRTAVIPSVKIGLRQLRFEEDALRNWIAGGGCKWAQDANDEKTGVLLDQREEGR
jgi:excisionase family DNA binding protein